MALKIQALVNDEGDQGWIDIRQNGAIYGRRFYGLKISGAVSMDDDKTWSWMENLLFTRLAPDAEVIFGGS